MKTPRDYVTTGEAAKACKVNGQTIVNWIDIGRLTCTRIEDGPRRIPPEEVIELLRRNNMEVPGWLTERAKLHQPA